MLTPYDVYEKYLAIRMHFIEPNYDFFKYSGKVRTSKDSFNKRKDRYFFEKLSRKKNEKEVIEFFVSNFIESSNPSKMWVGELKERGEENYINWKGRIQSLSYRFNQDLKKLTENHHLFEVLFSENGSHPKIIKQYLGGKVSIETVVILDGVTSFISKLNSDDPVLSIIINRVKKYKPFLSYDKEKFVNDIRAIL
jgi:hypothetical protein